MKNLLLYLLISISSSSFSQQLSPIELLTQPIQNKLAISGIGGLNLNDACLSCGASSAQFAIDWNAINFESSTRKGKDKITSHAIVFKANPIATTRMLNVDSVYAKKIVMVDNEHLVHIGYRLKQLFDNTSTTRNASFFSSPFLDFLYTPYNIRLSDSTNAKFNTLNLNVGYQFGLMQSKTKIGDIGFVISVQGNYLNIFEETLYTGSFDKVFSNNNSLSKNFAGLGGKFAFLFNDFAFFFELRKYFSIDNQQLITGLNDSPIVSFGFTATGTAIRMGDKIDNSY